MVECSSLPCRGAPDEHSKAMLQGSVLLVSCLDLAEHGFEDQAIASDPIELVQLGAAVAIDEVLEQGSAEKGEEDHASTHLTFQGSSRLSQRFQRGLCRFNCCSRASIFWCC